MKWVLIKFRDKGKALSLLIIHSSVTKVVTPERDCDLLTEQRVS